MFSHNGGMKGQGGQGTHLPIRQFVFLRVQSSEEDSLEIFHLKYVLKYCFHSAEQQFFFKNSSFLFPSLCEKGQNQTSTDGSLLTSHMTHTINSFFFPDLVHQEGSKLSTLIYPALPVKTFAFQLQFLF